LSARPYIPTIRDRPATWLRILADSLLNLLYPDSCFVCEAPVVRHQDCGICAGCWEKALALRIDPPFCAACGLPFEGFDPGDAHLCSDCTSNPPSFSGARSFGYYEGELSLTVQEFKFHGRRNLAALLGPLLAGALASAWGRDQIDLLCPVPLHPKRKRERGFNQSELLASSASQLLAIPLARDLLRRTRYTPPQVGLTNPERMHNVRGAFRCPRPELIAGRRVLLVDDVMTTGATLGSAARELLDAGALRVGAVTVARAVPHM
jgi:ComF family protein